MARCGSFANLLQSCEAPFPPPKAAMIEDMTSTLRGKTRSAVPALLVIALAGSVTSACGGADRTVPSADRAAFDDFAAAQRQWTRDGTVPWNKAFAAGSGQLATAGPKAEAAMAGAISKMDASAAKVTDPTVRARLRALITTFKGKLAAVRTVDNAGYSLDSIKSGLTQLKAEGVRTEQAWNGFVAATKKAWNANPLAGLKVG
jgi:hypothetical protein